MFDLDVSDDRVAVAALGRRLGLDVLSPAAQAADRSGAMPTDVARQLHDTGLTALVAEAYGGGGVPDVGTHMVAVEALAYGEPA